MEQQIHLIVDVNTYNRIVKLLERDEKNRTRSREKYREKTGTPGRIDAPPMTFIATPLNGDQGNIKN